MQRIHILYHFIPNASKNNIFLTKSYHLKIHIEKLVHFLYYDRRTDRDVGSGPLESPVHSVRFASLSDCGADCTVIYPGVHWSGGRWYIQHGEPKNQRGQ